MIMCVQSSYALHRFMFMYLYTYCTCTVHAGVSFQGSYKGMGVPDGKAEPGPIDLTVYRAPAPGDVALVQGSAGGRRVGPVRASHKWHGCIMLVAWLLCAPIAILLARYYRWTLPFAHLLLGSKLWFQVLVLELSYSCSAPIPLTRVIDH